MKRDHTCKTPEGYECIVGTMWPLNPTQNWRTPPEFDHEGTLRELSISSADDEDQQAAEWALNTIADLNEAAATLDSVLAIRDAEIAAKDTRIAELVAVIEKLAFYEGNVDLPDDPFLRGHRMGEIKLARIAAAALGSPEDTEEET